MKTKLKNKASKKKVQEAKIPEPAINNGACCATPVEPKPEPEIVRAAQLVDWAQKMVERAKNDLKAVETQKRHIEERLQHDELELNICRGNLYKLHPVRYTTNGLDFQLATGVA